MTETEFPAITLYQPWATWIMREWKLIETRTHSKFCFLKGKTILIHAGKTTDESAKNNSYLTREQILYKPNEIINGHILGSVYVHDFKQLNDSHSKDSLIDCGSVKRFGLFLSNVQKFYVPIPAIGEMGVWYYDVVKQMKVKNRKFDPNEIIFPE